MKGYKNYDLDDVGDVKRLNKLLNPAGIFFQDSLLGHSVMVDLDRYDRITKRKAGRRTVITQSLIMTIMQYRSEGMTVVEISEKTHVSKGIVCKVIRENSGEDPHPENQITIYDL